MRENIVDNDVTVDIGNTGKEKLNNGMWLGILVVALIVTAGAYYFMGQEESAENGMKVKFETTQGDIVIELYSDMPITTGNFKKLVGDGFYDGVIFHRIISGFMIQGGDPQGTGMGGPGYKIEDEFTHAGGNKNNRGTISMANSGPNTGGSQFFINLVGNNFLDSKHPAFGEVIEGMDIVDKIAAVETGAGDRPVTEVKIIKATII
jgi:peptidylprolyl isomerase